jgi:hypothetical protein
MTRQHIGVEARLRHVAGDHGADVGGEQPGALEDGSRGLDAEVDRGNRGEGAVMSMNGVRTPSSSQASAKIAASALAAAMVTSPRAA